MTDSDIDVIINEEEYKVLKNNQHRIKQLEAEIVQIQVQSSSKTQKIGQLEQQLQIQEEENAFLLSAILSIGNNGQKISSLGEEEGAEANLSGQYEVLGASIMYGTKLDKNQIQVKSGQLIKKYAIPLQRVKEIEDKIESQEELISKLNKLNVQNNELMLNKGIEQVLGRLQKEAGCKVNTFEELKKHLQEKETLKKKIKTCEDRLEAMNNQVQKLTIVLDDFKKKAFTAEVTVERLKTELNAAQVRLQKAEKKSELPKGDRPYRIKLLIDEHILEMKKDLCGVGDLSEKEVKELLSSQMQSLNEYIDKAISRNIN